MKILNRLKNLRAPPYVFSLEDKIKRWCDLGEKVEIIPKEADFDVLYVKKKHVPFSLSTKYSFLSTVTLVPKKKMTSELFQLYRRLKRMECILGWRGIIRRKPVFIRHPSHTRLLPHIKDLIFDDKLAKTLNIDEKLIKILSNLKPNLEIILYSLPEGIRVSDQKELFSHMISYYEKPEEIKWVITLELIFPPSLTGYDKIVRNIFTTHNIIARHIRKIVANIR